MEIKNIDTKQWKCSFGQLWKSELIRYSFRHIRMTGKPTASATVDSAFCLKRICLVLVQ